VPGHMSGNLYRRMKCYFYGPAKQKLYRVLTQIERDWHHSRNIGCPVVKSSKQPGMLGTEELNCGC
jgi:hypothetical protein